MQVPQSFREMPRWWSDPAGRRWLDELPARAAGQCTRWGLQVDGSPWHGSNALVLPVRRQGERLALRLSPPGDDVSSEAQALRFWDGRGTVRLLDVDLPRAATLLERLDGSTSLADVGLTEAVTVIASVMRRLARPAPDSVISTAEIAAGDAERFRDDWERLGQPTTELVLTEAIAAAQRLSRRPPSGLAANGDLHYEQVLAADREPWLVVDPVLFRGDIEYDLGRILWSRLDEMETDADVRRQLGRIVAIADLDAANAQDWVIERSMAYLLWGLDHGLTTDPVRCQRLLDIFG